MAWWDWLAGMAAFDWASKHNKRKRTKQMEELKIEQMKEELKMLKKQNGEKEDNVEENIETKEIEKK